jgi:hypothetical protein
MLRDGVVTTRQVMTASHKSTSRRNQSLVQGWQLDCAANDVTGGRVKNDSILLFVLAHFFLLARSSWDGAMGWQRWRPEFIR